MKVSREQAAHNRERILDAAARLFRERGFEGIGVARRAPHPDAAVLFFDFMLTDAQELLRNRDYFPATRETRPLPDGISVSFLDPVKDLDESRKWSRAYRDVVINQAR